MKKTVLILAAATAVCAMAQNPLDLQSRADLRAAKATFTTEAGAIDGDATMRRVSSARPSTLFAFVKIDSDTDLHALVAKGMVIDRRAGNILLAQVPESLLEELCTTEGVRRVQLSRNLSPKLDKARASVGIDKIHSGLELPQAYTGKGVIAGIVDGGMDPNHINFKDADGKNRIRHFTHIRLNEAGTTPLTSTYTPEQLPMFSTDDNTTYHGAHTMGIMAGGHRGTATVAGPSELIGGTAIKETDNPYYGAAYDAEIAASCGLLQDYFIAQGVSGILDYAYAQQKPCVINLSLGSNLGPHDGKGMMSQYLQAEAEMNGAIFCIAAGNEGDIAIAQHKTFTEDDTEFKTFIKPYVYSAAERNIRYGSLHIYSDDETEFDVRAVVYNSKRHRVAVNVPIKGNTNGQAIYYVSNSDYATGETDVVNANFAKAFDGYVGLGSMIDADSGRFYALIDFMTFDNQTTNADGTYLLGFIVSGKPGQRIDVFLDGTYTEFNGYGEDGWADGLYDGTISDLATTKSALIVGSYDTRDTWYSLDGGIYGYNGMFEPGTISEFSSFGETVDGRRLPHICAPGATIVSSTSTPFISEPSNGITDAYLQAMVKNGTRTDAWEQMTGTSMASPLVAGSIALWLEADPALTITDIMDIVAKTAVVDTQVETTGSPLQWGAGKFNAYEGLKEVLRRSSGVNDIAAEAKKPVITATGDRCFKVAVPGAATVKATVFDMAGRRVASSVALSDEVSVDLSATAPGVYIISANGTATRVLVK